MNIAKLLIATSVLAAALGAISLSDATQDDVTEAIANIDVAPIIQSAQGTEPVAPVIEYVEKIVEVPVIEYVEVEVPVVEYVEVETIVEVEVDKVGSVAEVGSDSGSDSYITALTTPCATEDSDNCYWNASLNGNGLGSSFVVVNGEYYYLGLTVATEPVVAEPVVETVVETVIEYVEVETIVEVAGPATVEYVVDQAAVDAAYAEGNVKADAAYQMGFEAGAATVAGDRQ